MLLLPNPVKKPAAAEGSQSGGRGARSPANQRRRQRGGWRGRQHSATSAPQPQHHQQQQQQGGQGVGQRQGGVPHAINPGQQNPTNPTKPQLPDLEDYGLTLDRLAVHRRRGLVVTDITAAEWCQQQLAFTLSARIPKVGCVQPHVLNMRLPGGRTAAVVTAPAAAGVL